MDVIGVGIYTFLNRLLIPTGLHHAVNNVFWFDAIGLGDLSAYWSGQAGIITKGVFRSNFLMAKLKTRKNTTNVAMPRGRIIRVLLAAGRKAEKNRSVAPAGSAYWSGQAGIITKELM